MQEDEEQRAQYVTCSITKKLDCLSSSQSQHCIFKVYDRLKRVNEKAYKPTTICIGPYHHHKYYQNTTLELMEERKLRYLQNFVRRTNFSVLACVKVMQILEEKARNCYAEPINDLNSNEFVEMMLLDSCFIVEFLINYETWPPRGGDDPIFQRGVIMDLLLLENQLPFFVLDEIFKMAQINLEQIIGMAIRAFGVQLPSICLPFDRIVGKIQKVEIKHLLSLMHYCWCFPCIEMSPQMHCCWCFQCIEMLPEEHVQDANGGMDPNVQDDNRRLDSTVNPLIKQVTIYCCCPAAEPPAGGRANEEDGSKDRHIKAATELQEFGIKFKSFDSSNLFDITFKCGTIRIPPFMVQDGTESIFRSLIAYEQYCLSNNSHLKKYFTDYVIFMDDLINSLKDVEILRNEGIILNYLGEDEAVSKVFNKLCLEITESSNYLYLGICRKVNNHCEWKCRQHMATLRRKYCNSPWAFISVVAAVILLWLTLTQTVFSILSVTKH